MRTTRRRFLGRAAGAAAMGTLVDLDAVVALEPKPNSQAAVTPDVVRFTPDVEPLVRRIEQTPREKCFEMMVDQLRAGLPYRRFLAALFLAGIRNVSPQPPGFKFHCVFVIHAAHQLSLDAPVGQRLLPLFWALDQFKASQAKDVTEGDFVLKKVKGKLPSPSQAPAELEAAMEAWDEPRADRAVAALVESRGTAEVIEMFWRYGARDYRNIGHKAIFVANTARTLETIGARHAAPCMRSLVLGLLDFGPRQKVNAYAFEDQCYLANLRRAQSALGSLPDTWTLTGGDVGVTRALLGLMRQGETDASCKAAVEALASGRARAGCVWDAVHLAAGELMMRQPGIYGIHTVTSANALQYGFTASASAETRLLLLLQGIGWMSQFARFMSTARGGLGDVDITALKPATSGESSAEASAAAVLDALPDERSIAASQAMRYASEFSEPDALARAASELIFAKGTDAHDYKYAAAIFETYRHVSPRWRPHMLATAVYNLRGTGHPDSPLMQRAGEVLAGL